MRRGAYVVELARLVEGVDSMSRRMYFPPSLYDALVAEGFHLPRECGDISMELPVDGVPRLHYVVRMSGDDLERWGKALARIGLEITQNDDEIRRRNLPALVTTRPEPPIPSAHESPRKTTSKDLPVEGCTCPVCEGFREEERRRMDMESQPPSLDELKPLPEQKPYERRLPDGTIQLGADAADIARTVAAEGESD